MMMSFQVYFPIYVDASFVSLFLNRSEIINPKKLHNECLDVSDIIDLSNDKAS